MIARPWLAVGFELALCAALVALAHPHAAQDEAAYRASVEKWRQDYEADLKSDHGWLTVAGLFWLHDGENRFGSDPLNDIVLPATAPAPVPSEAGYFDDRDGKIIVHVKPGSGVTLDGKPVETAELQADSPAARLILGDLTLYIHASGNRRGVRLLDKNSPLRRNFAGLDWFPVDPSYRIAALFAVYDPPRKLQIQNLAGDSLEIPAAGYVEFTLRGQRLRLDAYDDAPGKLEFVFRDLTSGKETYSAARFLDFDAPKPAPNEPSPGVRPVVLDFNEAYNPPCAYNPYTTCPLPPPQNRLRLRIEAGEKTYRHPNGN